MLETWVDGGWIAGAAEGIRPRRRGSGRARRIGGKRCGCDQDARLVEAVPEAGSAHRRQHLGHGPPDAPALAAAVAHRLREVDAGVDTRAPVLLGRLGEAAVAAPHAGDRRWPNAPSSVASSRPPGWRPSPMCSVCASRTPSAGWNEPTTRSTRSAGASGTKTRPSSAACSSARPAWRPGPTASGSASRTSPGRRRRTDRALGQLDSTASIRRTRSARPC